MSKKKKMTAEEFREILRKEGNLNENLSIFPDDKYNSILAIALGQAASQAFWEPVPEPKKRNARKKRGGNR